MGPAGAPAAGGVRRSGRVAPEKHRPLRLALPACPPVSLFAYLGRRARSQDKVQGNIFHLTRGPQCHASVPCFTTRCLALAHPGGGVLGAAFNRLRLAARPLRARAKHHAGRVREAACVAAATVTAIAVLSATVGRCAAACPRHRLLPPCWPAAAWKLVIIATAASASTGDSCCVCVPSAQPEGLTPPCLRPRLCSCLPVPAVWEQPGWVQHTCPPGHYNDLATAWLSPPGATWAGRLCSARGCGAGGVVGGVGGGGDALATGRVKAPALR